MKGEKEIFPKEREILPKHAYASKVAVVLLLDTSGSMAGDPIRQLNEGVRLFIKDVLGDDKARKSVDLAIVSFDSDVKVAQDFSAVEDINFQDLEAGGFTQMGEGIQKAIEMLTERKRYYRRQGITYYRPWLVLITDGAPTDMSPGDSFWSTVKQKLEEQTSGKHLIAWAFGTEGADFEALKDLFGGGRVYKVLNAKFADVFEWLSASMSVVSESQPGEQVKIENPENKGNILSTEV